MTEAARVRRPPAGSQRYELWVPKALMARVRAAAERQGVSASVYVRQTLARRLERDAARGRRAAP